MGEQKENLIGWLAKLFHVVFFFPYGGWWLLWNKGAFIFLRPDCTTGASGALGCGHPFAVQFLMGFSAAEQKLSVPDNLERVGEDDMAINP